MDPAALLIRARRRAGLTQAALARRAGTSQSVISAYERGHRDPTYKTLRRLIQACDQQLTLDTVRARASDLDPPVDLDEHARRFLDVLSLADAVPRQPRGAKLRAPRLVSR